LTVSNHQEDVASEKSAADKPSEEVVNEKLSHDDAIVEPPSQDDTATATATDKTAATTDTAETA